MGKRVVWVVAFLFVANAMVFGQGDRGTITGTVADAAKAVVGGASIEARNSESGATYNAATTETGNYTLAQLPAGTYQLTVTLPGFKKYIRQNIVVAATQTVRLDVELEVGVAEESITVNADVRFP